MTSDYVKTKMTDLDMVEMKRICYIMYNHIKENYTSDPNSDYSGQSTLTTQLYSQYNFLTALFLETNKFYFEIQKFFKESYDVKEQYMIQCWLNFYRKGEFIDWHRHWPMDVKGYHGFLCVSCEPSKTTYRLPAKHGVQIPTELIEKTEWETVDVESKNGLLVLSESAGDMHRTWPWEYDEPRITIAFDMIPAKRLEKIAATLTKPNYINHWIPI